MKTIFTIHGMHCDSCKEVIEDVCKELPGVKKCEARVSEGIVTIEHDTPLNEEQLIKEINALGIYKVLDVRGEGHDSASTVM
jgi:copper chaperone CopZ